MDDVTYKEAKSTADLPITDPIHKPCQAMAALENFDPALTQKRADDVRQLREKLFGNKPTQERNFDPLTYRGL